MKDRVVQFPHRYQLMPVAGQEGVYDFIPVPGVITEVGTPINKANLLSDETAALYGLSGVNANVDKALANIKNQVNPKVNTSYSAILANDLEVSAYDDVAVLSLSLPPGRYFINATVLVKGNITYLGIHSNTGVLCSTSYNASSTTHNKVTQSMSTIVELSSTTTITLKCRAPGTGPALADGTYGTTIYPSSKATQLHAIKLI